MKKRRFLGVKLTAAFLSAVIAAQMPVQTIKAAAAAKTQYFSELIISYGKDDNEAKNWLTNNGYKVLNQNLNEGGEGGTEALSWLGLASEKRSVYLGYKTTEDPNEAITDMKIMNMNGGYDYQAYEKILEETRLEKENFLSDIMAALAEYRENYAKAEGTVGKTKAQIAHDNLNKFRDDDSGMLMGDLLLNTLKTEDEAAWEADPSQHADMVTILMQGNSTVVSEIMQNLAFAADTADDSWLDRAFAAASADTEASNFDAFFTQFTADHPGWDTDQAIRGMKALYDDDAKMFAASLVGLRNYLASYTESGLSMEASPEEADAYFAEHPFESASTWASAANLYNILSNTTYGNTPLLNYLVYNDDDLLTDTALLEGYEDYGLMQRAKLYPLIAQMSEGQRCLLEYTALDRMISIGLLDETTWRSTYATMNDPAFGAAALEECSVYAEVNRDDFKVGEIAVTNAAQGKAASLGEEINEGLLGTGISYTTAGLFVGGIAVSVAGLAVAAKNWNPSQIVGGTIMNDTIKNTVESGGSIASNAVKEGANAAVKEVIEQPNVYIEAVKDSTKKLEIVYNQLSQTNNILADQNMDTLKRYINKITNPNITKAGPDAEKYLYKIEEVDNGTEFADTTITGYDGNQYKYTRDPVTGKQKLEHIYVEELDQTKKPSVVNPDIEKNVIMAAEQADDLAADLASNADELRNTVENLFDQSDELKKYFKDKLFMYKAANRLPDAATITDIPEDNFVGFLENAKQDGKLGDDVDIDALIAKRKQITEQRAALKMKEQADQVKQHIDGDIIDHDEMTEQADQIMTQGAGSSFWKWFGVGMAVAGLAMSVYSAYCAIDEMSEYYHMEMLPIPRKMVDLGYYEDGSTCYLYYDCTKCNRAEMGMANETLGDNGDLNGDVMKQWLALYTTKDARAGEPIKEGFTKKTGTTSLPVGKTPLAFFGFDYAVNMTDTRFTYNDKKNGIYLYYQGGANGAYTGTVTSANALVVTGALSALGGAGICAILMKTVGKRRKETAAQ